MKHLLVSFCLLLLAGPVLGAEGSAPKTDAPKADAFSDNACVQCHRDLPGRSYEIVENEWKHSVHYAAGVGCDGCHGGNPSARREHFGSFEAFRDAAHMQRNPEFLLMYGGDKEFVSAARGRAVSYFCGKCHSKIKEQHLGSPHGEFGDPTCLYCHAQKSHGAGSHKIVHPTPEIIDTRAREEKGHCSPCHRAGTMQAVGRIKKLLEDTEEHIQTSGKQYAQLEEWGYKNLELEKLHHHAKEVRSQLRQIFHSFNMRDINNFAAEIQGTVDRTAATYELVQRVRESQHRQTMVGICAVILLLSFAWLLVHYKKWFLEHHEPQAQASRAREASEAAIPISEKSHSGAVVP